MADSGVGRGPERSGAEQCFCCCVLIKPVNGSLMSLYHREGEEEVGEGKKAEGKRCVNANNGSRVDRNFALVSGRGVECAFAFVCFFWERRHIFDQGT